MWDNDNYCWAVICKNKWFHRRESLRYGHKIPLGPTDAFSAPPVLNGPFTARCDGCGKEYSYKPSELVRFESDLPASFAPHPLFR